MNKKLLRKKLALMLATLKKKRKFFCEVEYLATTNQQDNSSSTTSAAWIDTGIIPDDTTKIECRMAFTTLISGNSQEALCGTTSGTNGRFAWGFANVAPLTRFYFGLGGENLTSTVTRNTNVHTFKLDAINKTWGIDSNTGSFTSSGSLSSTASIFLFGRHSAYYVDKVNRPANAKVYYCKIWKGGSLVRDFIPVLDWNYVPCMYDRVTEQLFYNAGTGTFSYGMEIHQVDYIEGTGTQYINTGIYGTQNTRFEVDLDIQSGAYQRVGGSFNDTSKALTLPWNNINDTSDQVFVRFGNFVTTSGNTPRTTIGRKTISVDKTGYYVNETKLLDINYTGSFTTTGTLWLFSSNPSTGMMVGKIYGSKIYDNGTLVRDFIPAIDENDTFFMFDKITHTTYNNSGYGSFIGPTVEKDENGKIVEPEYE